MASIQSTQKYMNNMAAALQIVTKLTQPFIEKFASQDYEEISTFVTTTLDAYWNDDNYSLLHNIDDFLQYPFSSIFFLKILLTLISSKQKYLIILFV